MPSKRPLQRVKLVNPVLTTKAEQDALKRKLEGHKPMLHQPNHIFAKLSDLYEYQARPGTVAYVKQNEQHYLYMGSTDSWHIYYPKIIVQGMIKRTRTSAFKSVIRKR